MTKFEYLKKTFNIFGYYKGNGIEKLEEEIKRIYKRDKGVYVFENGRTSEYAFLKAVGVNNTNNVVMQAFTCTAAVNPILWLKSTPIYVDIYMDSFTMNLNSLKERVNEHTKVIMIQHTFSHTAKVREIVKFAHDRGIYVLEDCAHSLGIVEHGVLGGAMFISFGIDKTLSTRVGGALIVNNYELDDLVSSVYNNSKIMNRRNTFLWLLNPLFWQVLRASARLYTPILNTLLGFKLLNLGHIDAELDGSVKNFTPKKLSSVLADVVIDQLSDLESNIEHRKLINEIYEKELGVEYMGMHSHKFSLYMNPKLRDQCVKELSDAGYMASRIYTNVISPKEVDLVAMKYNNDCPSAEELVKGIVNLPNLYNISIEDAKNISKIVKKYI